MAFHPGQAIVCIKGNWKRMRPRARLNPIKGHVYTVHQHALSPCPDGAGDLPPEPNYFWGAKHLVTVNAFSASAASRSTRR
jgi:hypothetical protein